MNFLRNVRYNSLILVGALLTCDTFAKRKAPQVFLKEAPSKTFEVKDNRLSLQGPVVPFRYKKQTRFIIGSSTNYTVTLTDWNKPETWQINTKESTFDSNKNYPKGGGRFYHQGPANCGPGTELDYDHLSWLYSFYPVGKNIYALAHQEWYDSCTKDGLPKSGKPGELKATYSLLYFKSPNGGLNFYPRSYAPFRYSKENNSFRTVAHPRPIKYAKSKRPYGLSRPSNMVKEGKFVYAFSEYRDDMGTPGFVEGGFIILRTADITEPADWQVYTARGWQTINTFLGTGGIAPKVYFSEMFDPTNSPPPSTALARSIRYSKKKKLWFLFGTSHLHGKDSEGRVVKFSYSYSKSLAEPEFDKNGIKGVDLNFDKRGMKEIIKRREFFNPGNYLSVFDPSSTHSHYKFLENSPYVYLIKNGRSIWRARLEIK